MTKEDNPGAEVEGHETDYLDDGETAESLSREEIIQALHALLFCSDRPVSAGRLVEALGDIDEEQVRTLLDELRELVEANSLPYEVREIAGGYQLITKPMFGPFIKRMLQIKRSNKLSKSALETLAIVAYKQPTTRAEVEAVRGVSVAHAFDILLERRLIKVSGVAEAPGRPKLYRTSEEFLVHFGLSSLKELPTIDELREMA